MHSSVCACVCTLYINMGQMNDNKNIIECEMHAYTVNEFIICIRHFVCVLYIAMFTFSEFSSNNNNKII